MLPEGWQQRSMERLCSLSYGKALSKEDYNTAGASKVYGTGGVLGCSDMHLGTGPAIILGRKGTIDQPFYVPSAQKFWAIDTTYYVNTSENIQFLYYLINNIDLKSLSEATSMPSLNRNSFYSLKVILPPAEEQKRIAEILSGVDEAIEATKAVIAQNKKVKQGLLQTLLTHGIGHKEFQRSELELIPKKWRVTKLGAVTQINPRNIKNLGENTNVTFLAMADLSEEAEIVTRQLRPYGAVNKGFTCFSENDVLVAKITPCFENGKGAIATNLINQIGFGSTEFHVIRATSEILPKFIYYHTISKRFRGIGSSNMTGTAGQKRVTKEFLSEYLLALPPLPEQEMIVSILEGVDSLLKSEVIKLTSMRALKKGLMHDLLSGKVRVA